ncbi:MAG: FUSC family protein [Acidobacteriaceae bacterium]|nr:FUSC family protein [Acidobacteriaceae bacterium]
MTALGAVSVALVSVLFGAVLLTGEPILHFAWAAGTLLLTFFLIDTLSEYRAGTAFGFLAVSSIAVWDFPANTETRVEATLWTALAILTAASVTVAVEAVFQRFHPFDQFAEGLCHRIQTVENLLRCLSQGSEIDKTTLDKLTQYAMTGTGSLRRLLLRSNLNPHHAAEMSAVVALIGRLVDLSANIATINPHVTEPDKPRYAQAAKNLGKLRSGLLNGTVRQILEFERTQEEPPVPGSFVPDIENAIARIPQVFVGQQPLSEFLPSAVDFERPSKLFKDDAFSNPAHFQFALKSTLAAVSCYLIYNAIDWPGLSTSVTTCMITALSTVGSSRQKQLLRVSGAILGGVGFSIAAEVFVLPRIDNIAEFTLLFVAVTGISSWVATASPRLSYAGVQTAFAFYITQLRGFGPQRSLAVARDDVMGILFGLFAMWFISDQIWAKNAVSEMMDSFVANMRRIAVFDKQIIGDDLRKGIDRSRRERAAIDNNFDKIRNQSDAVIFEFGSGWHRKVGLRNQVRAWQPQLRTYFLLQVALLHYRLQSPDRMLDAQTERKVQQSEDLLTMLADLQDSRKEGQAAETVPLVKDRVAECAEELRTERNGAQDVESTPLRLSRSMLEVAVSLGKEMQG